MRCETASTQRPSKSFPPWLLSIRSPNLIVPSAGLRYGVRFRSLLPGRQGSIVALSLRFPYLALSYLTLLSFVSASPHSTYKAASTAIIFRTTAFQNILLFPSRLHIILDLDAAAPLAFSHVPISETRFQGI